MCSQNGFNFLRDIVINGLSGFIGGLLTAVVSVTLLLWQLKASQKTTNFSNLLKLKELFNLDRNWNTFRYFLEENVSEPENSTVYEYLGLYELAYEMWKENQISDYEFFNMYSYRINSFASKKRIVQMIKSEPLVWEKLVELILINNEWGYKHKRIDYKSYIYVKKLYKQFKSSKK